MARVCLEQLLPFSCHRSTNHLMEYYRIVECLQSIGESPSVGQFCEVLIRSILKSLEKDSPHDSPSDVMPTSVLVDMVKEFPMEEAFVDELTRYVCRYQLHSLGAEVYCDDLVL